MSTMASHITGVWLFAQKFVQAQIKENIKALRHWRLWGEFTRDCWIAHTRASNTQNNSIWWHRHALTIELNYVAFIVNTAEKVVRFQQSAILMK